MHLHSTAAATLIALLLTGCAGAQSQQEPIAQDGPTPAEAPTSETPPVEEIQSSPEDTASTSGSGEYVAEVGPVEVTNGDGYTGVLEGTVTLDAFATSIEDAKPGFADIQRMPPSISATFTNTTNGRTAPTLGPLTVTAYYPAEAGVCEAFLAYPPFTEVNYDPEIDRSSRGERLGIGAEYCFVNVGSFETWGPSGYREVEVPADSTMSYKALYGDEEDAMRMGQFDEVPEAEADDLVQNLNNPSGVLIYAWGDPAVGYSGDFECPALPVTTTWWTGNRESQFPRGDVRPLLDTGTLC